MRRRLPLLGLLSLLMALQSLMVRATPVNQTPISMTGYIARLDAMRNLLQQKRVAEAQQRARALQGTHVETVGGSFTADPSLLDAVLGNRVGTAGRLAVEVAALRKNVPAATTAGDARLLERLRREEAASKIRAGGEVLHPPVAAVPLLDRIVAEAEKILEWIGEKLLQLWDWLTEMWPRQKASGGSAVRTRFVVGALALAVVTVIGILVWEVMRRSRRNVPEPVAGSEPVASSRDADPLSRGASEWERYAAQLAAAGRLREAIRAWYHAVLVTCYGAGILHYRKGRTNWEYVGAISPEALWRSDFITLTRAFETEWYGHTMSTREALEACSERAGRILDGLRSGAAA
jgi:Domain of unknown function (DUF4129)